MTVEAQWAEGARAADISQAVYIRAFLIEERKRVSDDLVQARARLRDCLDGGQVVGLRAMSRSRFQVRELEAKQREVERLIAALDRRFGVV